MRCPNRPSASCKTWDPSLPIHKSQGNCMTTLIFDGTMQSPTSYKSQREALLSHPLGPKSDFTMSISADARWKDVTLYHTSSVLKTSLNAYWLNYPSWFFLFLLQWKNCVLQIWVIWVTCIVLAWAESYRHLQFERKGPLSWTTDDKFCSEAHDSRQEWDRWLGALIR